MSPDRFQQVCRGIIQPDQLVEIHKVISLPGKDLLTANLADDKSILHFHVAAFLRLVILKK